jgi:response regulator NasT
LGALGYLVKPLDVKQIVPAVRAALAKVRERGLDSGGAPPAVRPAAPQPDAAGARDQQVAIGILMERLRLDYDRAQETLRAQARSETRSVEEIASSMVEAANRLNSVAR